jgi:hypothetical protein
MASNTKVLRDGVAAAIAGWVPSPLGTWPSFTPFSVWYLTENLDGISGLTVNVAPGAISGVPKTRRDIERTTRIAIQIAKKLESLDELDGLMELAERLEQFLYSTVRTVSGFSLSKTEIQAFDWKLLEQKRTFHTVLIATFLSLE